MTRWLIALGGLALAPLIVTAACDDVTVYDVPLTDEAGLEGGLGVVDDGSGGSLDRFCAHTEAGLCADFDGPNIGAWANVANQIAPTDPPKGADLEVGDGPTGKDLVATLPAGAEVTNLAKGFVSDGTGAFRAEADLNVPRPFAAWTDEPVGVLGIVYGTNGLSATVRVRGVDQADGEIELALDGGATTSTGSAIVPFDTWFHVALAVDPSAKTATLVTSTGLDAVATTPTVPVATPAEVTLFVGLKREAPTVTPTTLLLQADNVAGFVR